MTIPYLIWQYSGFPEDQIRYLLCIFTIYPLSLMYRKYIYTWDTTYKHVLSVVISSLFCVYAFGRYSVIHSLGMSLAVWVVLKFVTNPIHKPQFLVFGFCMGYLSLLQIHRMYYHWMEWSIDVSGTQMLLTIKMTSFAFNYVKRQTRFPSLLEWLGYTYFYPSFLVGPTISFEQYSVLISDNTPKKTGFESMKVFLTALMFLLPVYLQMRFPMSYLSTDEFANSVWWSRWLYLYFCMLFIRFRYYAAWTFGKAFFIAFGAGEYGNNINILNVEIAQNVHEITNNWNLCTNDWLKSHVYENAMSHGFSKQTSTYITNTVSALWHGFYPGYMLTFVSGGVMTDLGRKIRKTIRPFFQINRFVKLFYDIVCTIMMWICIAYFTVPFQVYSFVDSIVIWYNCGFLGHVLMFGGYLLVFLVQKYQFKKEITPITPTRKQLKIQ